MPKLIAKDTYNFGLWFGIETLSISFSLCFTSQILIHHKVRAKVMVYKYFKIVHIATAVAMTSSEKIIWPNVLALVISFISKQKRALFLFFLSFFLFSVNLRVKVWSLQAAECATAGRSDGSLALALTLASFCWLLAVVVYPKLAWSHHGLLTHRTEGISALLFPGLWW